MKLGWPVALSCAIVVHGGILAFGGIFTLHDGDDHATLQQVDLLDDAATKKDDKKPDEPQPEEQKDLDTHEDAPPDASKIVESLELAPEMQAPALDAASLSAIEQALNGGAGGGDFAESVGFASGGRIGALGKAGAGGGQSDDAFSLAEIDQKPRAMVQVAPQYPSELRSKKVEGVVTVIFVVDASGKPQDTRVEKSTHPAFERPALDAVRQWRFEPAVKGGQRVACKMRVPIRFQPIRES